MPHWIMVDLLHLTLVRFPSLTLRTFDCADFAGGGLQLPPRTIHNIVNDCVDVVNRTVTLFVQASPTRLKQTSIWASNIGRAGKFELSSKGRSSERKAL